MPISVVVSFVVVFVLALLAVSVGLKYFDARRKPIEFGLLLLNILLSVFTILLVYLIAEDLSGNIYIALLSAAALTFYPTQVNYVHYILTEVPVTFFLA